MEILETIDYRVNADTIWLQFIAETETKEFEFSHTAALELLDNAGEIRIGYKFSIPGMGACRLEKLYWVDDIDGGDEKISVVHSHDFLKDILDTELADKLLRLCEVDTEFKKYFQNPADLHEVQAA